MPWADRFIKVQVAGNDLTADTLDGVQVSAGTRDWWDQNVNGYARITLYDEQPNVAIGDELTVEVESPEEAATGGTITTYTSGGVTYIVHRFATSGTFSVTSPITADWLIVGGGGAGGSRTGAGGGGGGVVTGTGTLTPGNYTVTIGLGGSKTSGRGNPGGNSSFNSQTAIGGGGGGSNSGVSQYTGGNGGSGGGGSGTASAAGGTGTAGQGFAGGTANGWPSANIFGTGGGGGAGAVGQNAPTSPENSGTGGNGVQSSITGTAVYYGGGGGGGKFTYTTQTSTDGRAGGLGGGGAGSSTLTANAVQGTDGLGGGGGGSSQNRDNLAADGGDGVVIIAYPDPVRRIFTGTVSSIETQLTTAGPFWTVQATGPLTKAGRRVLNSTIAAGLDGDQIEALAIEALGIQWQQVGTAWQDQTLTWDGFGVDTSEIDTPGVYQLDAITNVPADVLDQLVLAAFSGQGWLYETHQGTLGYADSTRRETTPADQFIELPGSAVELQSVLASSTDADIVNQAVVEWSGGDVTFNSSLSQGLYGLYSRNFTTTLDDVNDATDYAQRRVQLDSAPRTSLPSGVRVNLRLLTDDQLDDVLAVTRNSGLIIEDFPTYLLPEGRFRGFVEGYVWTIGTITAYLDLYISDYALSVFGLRWAATGTVAWQDVAATVTWADTEESL